MSLTATGLEVNSKGGNLGGLIASLIFSASDLYHGSSTLPANRRSRWASAVAPEMGSEWTSSGMRPSIQRAVAHFPWTRRLPGSLQVLEYRIRHSLP